MTTPVRPVATAEARLAYALVAPSLLVLALVALVPIVATLWDALHRHDLRLPWLGHPLIGAGNFLEAAADPRFRLALLHSVLFAAVSVPIELGAGIALALVMHHAGRARALVRAAALLPWAIPTVVAALVWRFMTDAQTGVATAMLVRVGLVPEGFDWFVHPWLAWAPIIAADAWKTTPFVAVLLLAGRQAIDPGLYEAARVDGAGALRQFSTITLPLLTPTLLVAATFRALDALRLFDLPYVMTGGGPGTATEPASLYAFTVLMQRLRFGYGSALGICVFAVSLLVALVCARFLVGTLRER